jgi:broad specificity phosphatase PhoE
MGNSGSTPLSPKGDSCAPTATRSAQRILSLDTSQATIFSHPIVPSSPSSPPVNSSPTEPPEKQDNKDEEAVGGKESDEQQLEEAVAPCGPPFTSSCLIVMRHGQRLDDIMEDWETSTSRPWDPPLTTHGYKQARETGLQIKGKLSGRTMRIHSSPFKRCLQTAVEVAKVNGIEQVEVSFGLCEMLSRIKTAPPDARRVIEWLWGSGDEGEGEGSSWSTVGWRRGGQMEVQGIRIIGISANNNPQASVEKEEDEGKGEDPCYPESIAQAYGRFDAEFRRLSMQVKEEEVVLAVTHGDAVGRCCAMSDPNTMVYEVVNTGYCCLAATGEEGAFALIEAQGVGYYRETDDMA